jgi:hypothetical protein
MSPAAVRPADWGNAIALSLLLLLFRAFSLYVNCASAVYLNSSPTKAPSPLEIVIVTLSSSTSPLTIAFGLVICSDSSRHTFRSTNVPLLLQFNYHIF